MSAKKSDPHADEQELFVVATPIGNMGDMTYRAVETLKNADLILAEDTRTTGMLLKHFEISKRMWSYHSANEYRGFDPEAVFRDHRKVALVTENGTPGISDPGQMIVSFCHEHKIRVTPIPGASAGIACLSAAGFSGKTHLFFGFLPNKKSKRKNILYNLLEAERKVIIFYESPYRLVHTLQLLAEKSPLLPVVVGREMTKLYEEIQRKNAKEMLEYYDNQTVKGEVVLIVDNRNAGEADSTVNFESPDDDNDPKERVHDDQ